MTSDDYHELFRDLAFVRGMFCTGDAADAVLTDFLRRGVISGDEFNEALLRIEAEENARAVAALGPSRFCRAMRARVAVGGIQ